MIRKLLALVGVAFASAALASSVVPRSLEERVQRADRVVFAQVVGQRTVNQGTLERPRLVTFTRVVVGEQLKGQGPAEFEVMQLGGRWGLWEQHVSDDARFEVGETAVLLLQCPAGPEVCRLYGLADGKLNVNGGDAFVRDMVSGQWSRRSLSELFAQLRRAAAPVPAKGAR